MSDEIEEQPGSEADFVDPFAPSPEARKRVANPQGVPLRMGDGRTWVIAHGTLAPMLLPNIDRAFDQLQFTKSIDYGDALQVVCTLIAQNYDLTAEEIAALLAGVPDEEIAQAACIACFGPVRPRRTWSTWALSSLYANNIEPNAVPRWLLRDVLYQLVMTGRAMGQSDYIDSCAAVKEKAQIMDTMRGGGVRMPDDPTQDVIDPAADRVAAEQYLRDWHARQDADGNGEPADGIGPDGNPPQ